MIITKSYYRKKHPKVKHSHSSRGKDRSETINKIFDSSTKDMSYVTASPELLKAHRWFIMKTDYSNGSAVRKFVVPDGPCKGYRPEMFDFFRDRYPYIYEWWVHIIRGCLDPTYPTYKFIGGRGLYLTRDFLDSKTFCVWCLQNGLTSKPGMYCKYIQRKNKNKHYSFKNCFVISEKEVHECKSLPLVMQNLCMTKMYEEGHAENVSFMTAYTRYYVYDLPMEDAVNAEYKMDVLARAHIDYLGFSPAKFYESVATKDSCSYTTFKSRMHYSFLNGGFIAHPYDMLKPDFSVSAEANKQGKLSYKQQYCRDKKKDKEKIYSKLKDNEQLDKALNDENNSVYSTNPSIDIYS